ncbi:hypothetical protein WKW79_36230 [Variovorax robiniae]|uniref:Uncharacterized protein n=1 Tax=Variovorax robiniae TaxID=1836199 RepID=A0ABU8XMV8_9BURK
MSYVGNVLHEMNFDNDPDWGLKVFVIIVLVALLAFALLAMYDLRY